MPNRNTSAVIDWTEKSGCEYVQRYWKPADEITVNRFRHIFTWPLVLEIDDSSSVSDQIELAEKQFSESKNSPWKKLNDLADYAGVPTGGADVGISDTGEQDMQECVPADYDEHADKAARYSEFVFFHEFAQALFFANASHDNSKSAVDIVSIYSRDDIKSLEATIRSNQQELTFRCALDRLCLYRFKTGAVMLVVEINHGSEPSVTVNGKPRRMTLADAQDITDQLRRVYSPFLYVEGDVTKSSFVAPSRAPLCLSFMDENGKVVAEHGPDDLFTSKHAPSDDALKPDKILDQTLAGLKDCNPPYKRRTPILSSWRKLVAPIQIAGHSEDNGAPVYRQVMDERMPTMSYIHLANNCSGPRSKLNPLLRITRGDWIRLCFADEQGKSDYPYSPAFVANFEQECCYDRYFPSKAMGPDTGTRLMFSGYHFCMVTSGKFGLTNLFHHFRRHYFHLAVIIQLELVSLLATSSKVSKAVRQLVRKKRSSGALEKFSDELEEAERDFLEYTHLFHFTGLSNQLQPTEMFEIWRNQAGIPKLYDEVKEEVQAGNQFLNAREQRETARAATRLNVLATIGLVFGLIFSFLGMNVLIGGAADEKPWISVFDSAHWKVFGLTTLFFSLGGLLLNNSLGSDTKTSHSKIINVFLTLLSIFSATLVFTIELAEFAK